MSVSTFLVRAVVEAVEGMGAARGDWRAPIPLALQHLEQPYARLEFEQFERLLSAAAVATGDEAFGLHLAEHVSESAVDLLGHLAAHSPTMREAIEINARFIRLVMDEMVVSVRDEGDLFVVRYTFPRSTPRSDRMLADFLLGGVVRLARYFTGPSTLPRFASFEHERPNDHREYERVFGNDLRFGQRVTSIAFDRDIADRRQIHQHPEFYSLLRAEAERLLDRIAPGARPTTRLREYLLAMPPSRIPEISRAARDLGMSERSLRRHLAAEGTSYRHLVQSALMASAGYLLRDPTRSIKETAAALGFAEAAAFHHAFKRWTGMSPSQFRRARPSQ
jgi:AraC-like DNA-binding protein